MKRISNTNCIKKSFINIRKLNLIKNIRIDELMILTIYEKKQIIKKRNLKLKNDFKII